MALRLRPPYKAPRGTTLHCRGWRQEAFLRLLLNNLENAERPEDLIVYGGTGRAARSHADLQKLVRALRTLGDEDTLVVQSGRPQAIFRTHADAPRVLFANSNLVPHWANWEHFRGLEAAGLMMYGQMTAGCWSYIGAQGIIQGTYETFAAVARTHFDGSLQGRLVLTGGLGGMGGAQPLAAKMAGAVCIAVEADPRRIARRKAKGYVDHAARSLDDALSLARDAQREGRAASIALEGNCADTHPALVKRGVVPDVVTDQTSAHDALGGYIPAGFSIKEADALRRSDPKKYIELSMASMAKHSSAMLHFQKQGSVVFDYGNNLRGQAQKAGVANAFAYPGFVQAYVRPMFCEGRGPFRWIALSGEPEDILATDQLVLKLFPKDKLLRNWIELAEDHLPWEGLPARVCWLGLGERDKFAARMNELVARGKVQAPMAITRDHLDTGSVASPYRETEGMRDGSDAVADWPILNALLNTACGADMVAVHSGGGVGIGLSVHAGMTVVADGSAGAARRIRRVFVADPGMGVVRHADAGYVEAQKTARRHGLRRP
ncbi:MAG TPA: urocanate hydratase [Candidatus Thermoplasmatota archaeon]|jgi:urocanate hydratase|nr:urocanate hydratase [Candidatus Thermoplasmatota archaeon]